MKTNYKKVIRAVCDAINAPMMKFVFNETHKILIIYSFAKRSSPASDTM